MPVLFACASKVSRTTDIIRRKFASAIFLHDFPETTTRKNSADKSLAVIAPIAPTPPAECRARAIPTRFYSGIMHILRRFSLIAKKI